MRSLPDDPAAGSSLPRLEFLDGMRGLAALYVVLYHAAYEIRVAELPWAAAHVHRGLSLGHYAVAIFIVLSGYCLMLPVVRDPNGRLRGGFVAYIKRRATRILPPYYAALSLFVALIILMPGVRLPSDSGWDNALPALQPGVILSHLFLVHNFNQDWIFRVVPPMWSVATEWQIYLIFPLLVLVWRRLGILASVAAAIVFGYWPKALSLLAHVDVPVNASFWYTGLFAFGMAAAVIGFSSRPLLRKVEERVPWAALAALLAALAFVLLQRIPHRMRDIDHFVGAATACLIIFCARAAKAGVSPAILRLFQARWVVAIGGFSYSLYLVHYSFLSMVNVSLREHHWGPAARFAVLVAGVVPLTLVPAYAFHLVFERRFMPKAKPQTTRPSKPPLKLRVADA